MSRSMWWLSDTGLWVCISGEGSGYTPMLRSVIAAIAAGSTESPVPTADHNLAVLRTIDEIFAQIR